MDCHFSVQAVEKAGNKDCDLDGLVNEITVGNVTALTAYVTMFRPPQQNISSEKTKSVASGAKYFNEVGCVNCHKSSSTIEQPMMTIMTSSPVPETQPCPREVAQLTNPQRNATDSEKEAHIRVEAAFTDAKIHNIGE